MSSLFDRKKIVPRYKMIAYVMLLLGIVIIARALYISTVKRDYWMQVASRLKKDSVVVKPVRGNILSCDGRLMASSLPEFKMYMDFKALHDAGNDSLWYDKLDSICNGLNQIFPQKSAAEFRTLLETGHAKMARNMAIWPRRVDYSTYSEVKRLPVFNLISYKGGFHAEEFNARKRPFGTLASRTVGDMFGAKDTARFGLELAYDTILRGTNGLIHRNKVLNKYLDIMDTPPIDGADIVTTLDVGIQDLAERAVIDELREINGNVGVAIVMEVATGDIKAIVNMEKCLIEGRVEYRELKNHAVSDLLEPGSVFKTASMMVALDDGKCDTSKVVETGGGVYHMHGRDMKDHNWRRGGYGAITLARGLEVSSNIVVSRIIDEYYSAHPEQFVDRIYSLGIAEDLHIPLKGSSPAKIRRPRMDKTGKHWANWSKTALPWMSIGYETQIPPISTLTFYNAIANNGKMVAPRFIKHVSKDGQIIREFPVRVIKEHIAKPQTVKTMQTILEHVVSQGLGKKAGSQSFKVAGKTGTAQIAKGGGYHSGTVNYLLSFAGFFPADNPRYSCIVCIQKSGLPASGGGMSGVVFHHIAEGIMAQNIKLSVVDARDSASVMVPSIKDGNILAADYVLSRLNVRTDDGWSGKFAEGAPIWGKGTENRGSVQLQKVKHYGNAHVPDVRGMGARDAVFMLESRGVRVRIEGRGKVTEQSLPPGHFIKKGETCLLKLR